jgi:GGDEF domain-containing protein
MAEHRDDPVDRRVAVAERKRVDQMSPEEMRRALLTSGVTGLPNRRAFDEAGEAPAVAMSDVDGLNALNRFGYDTGNALLRAKADTLRETGLDAFHDKGDEFLCRANSTDILQANLELARALLRGRTIVVRRTNGESLSFTGADFSFGTGKDVDQAESALKRHKAEREKRGEIARGELRGIIIKRHRAKESCQETSTLMRVLPSVPYEENPGGK